MYKVVELGGEGEESLNFGEARTSGERFVEARPSVLAPFLP